MSGWTFDELKKNMTFGGQDDVKMPESPSEYGDWQRYAGFNANNPGFQGDMANPANFGSFKQFSNMGMKAIVPPAVQNEPVPPTMDQAKERLGQALDQLKQGNFGDALHAYQYGQKKTTAIAQPSVIAGAPVQQDQDMMSMEFGD